MIITQKETLDAHTLGKNKMNDNKKKHKIK